MISEPFIEVTPKYDFLKFSYKLEQPSSKIKVSLGSKFKDYDSKNGEGTLTIEVNGEPIRIYGPVPISFL